MDYIQSTAIWFALRSIITPTSERRVPGEASLSQPEEEFVPFRLPPVKPQQTEEAQPRVPVAA